jgi:hypothetical protein
VTEESDRIHAKDSLFTRCHAIVELITVEERCAIIPDNTCTKPMEKFGTCIKLPISPLLPNCSSISFSSYLSLKILFARAVQCVKYGNCSSSWLVLVLYNVT